MPLYQYDCQSCGVFSDFAAMKDFDQPCACPSCGAPSPRAGISLPKLAILSSSSRTAHETNERSAHAPKSTRSHGPGCSCCSGGSKSKPTRTLHRPDGSKSFPSSRPWMISH